MAKLASLAGLAILIPLLLLAVFSSECTYSFWYVTVPNTARASAQDHECWILTTKWYVPKSVR